ncbi:hypothetical protein SELMODRAFT_414389 [Selaginella moellendorffii]|uniref:Uncharacterized protein n=1 Tax=Selaginella moellendorffii TaxID=88036 RepID=D8RSL2_SELML|nr:hypothetical protein SELMODRAFT_414389 [Selaginella moellendorffii]
MASLTYEWERPPQLQVWRLCRKHDNNPNYRSEKCPIVELKEILHTELIDTVPFESSKVDGFTATARHRVPCNHRSLLRSNGVFLLFKDILEIKDEKKKLAVHAAPYKSDEVIKKQAHFCLSDTAISHKNSAWDANSKDSQNYNSGSESKDNTKNSVVLTINT